MSRGRLGHLLSAFFLLISLLAPLTLAMPTAAAPQPGPQRDLSVNARRDGAPPPLPNAAQVIVSGDFGDVGLADNDGDGTWDGFFQIAPGSYDYRIIHVSDEQRSLGENGDPDGGDLNVDVPDDAIAVYFAYNSLTGAISGNVMANDVQIVTDVGTFQMAPTDDGDFEVYFDHPGGSINVQVTVDGQPGDASTVDSDTGGRARVEANDNGSLTDAEMNAPATLSVQKTDEAGNPLPGSCFALYDGNDVLSQDCDFNDGSNDGTTVLRFPNGAPDGDNDLAETFTPDGDPQADDQEVDVDPGDNIVQVAVAGGVVEEPTDGEEPVEEPTDGEEPIDEPEDEPTDGEEPIDEPVEEPTEEEEPEQQFGSLIVFANDEDGNPVGGVCYEISTLGQTCDEDGDGDMALLDIPTGDYDVTILSVPDGYELPDDQTDGATVESGEEATVTFTLAQSEPETGSLQIAIQSEDGFALLGACVTIDGPQGGSLCDNDQFDADPSDGSILIQDIPAGDYQVSLDSAPEGFEAAEASAESATVEPGGQVQVTLIVPAAAPPTNDLLVTVRNQNGDRVGGSCIQLDGPQSYGPICDNDENDANDDDGRIRFNDVQLGDYTATMTQAPQGFNQPDSLPLTVAAGETARLTVELTGTTGTLIAITTDPDGNPVGGVCYEITGLGQSCDEDGDGDMTLTDTPAGDYTVTQVSVPEGFDVAAEPSQDVAVESGGEAQVVFTSEPSAPETGSLQIAIQDEGGQPVSGVCIAVEGPQNGTLCDNDDGDQDDSNGVILLQGLQPGDYQVGVDEAPDEFSAQAAEGQAATVEAGAQAAVTLTVPPAAPPTGTLLITKENAAGDNLAGACFTLSGTADVGPICDNQEGDVADDEGVIGIADLQVGEYTLTESTAPEGYTAGDPQTIQIDEGETTDVTVTNAQAQGILQVVTVDQNGNPVPDACYDSTNFGEVCDQDADGDMTLTEAPVGDYEVTQTQLPEGYEPSEETTQEATVVEGETAVVTFTVELQAGTIQITKTDGENPLGGACFTVDGGNEVCDNGDGDADGDEGTITIENVAPGDHTVAESQVPEGYEGAADQTVTVPAGGTAEATFENALEQGGVVIEVTDEETGDAVGGACVQLDGPESVEVCDNGDGDANPDDGVIEVQNLTPGDYTATFTALPDGFEDPGALPITVGAGEPSDLPFPLPPLPEPTEEPTQTAEPTQTPEPEPTQTAEPTETPEPTQTPIEEATEEPEPTQTPTEEPADATATPTEEPTEEPALGQVVIVKTNEGGDPLGGACFTLSGPSEIGPVCDNEAGDQSGDEGTILVAEVPVGDYVVTETQAPEGFSAGTPQEITVGEGDPSPVTFVNVETPPAIGSVRIVSTGPEDASAGGGTYEVDGVEVTDNGDGDGDAAPGVILIDGIQVGQYEVTETEAPPDLLGAGPQPVEVVEGEAAEVVFTHELAPPETGGLEFQLQDADGNPVEGACVTLTSGELDAPLVLCDGGPEDTDPTPGVLVVQDLPVGVYSVQQSEPAEQESAARAFGLQQNQLQAPAGPFAEKTVTVQANVIIVVIVIIIIQPPDEGDLIVIKQDADTNQLLGGACFRVTGQGDDVEICDNDGNDGHGSAGFIRFDDLATGVHTLSETTPPPGYQGAADQQVDVEPGVSVVEVDNTPIPDTEGDLIVNKVDVDGDPLQNSCFVLRQGNAVVAGPVCDADDGNDGVVTFADVAAGNYTLRETQPPSNDYFTAPDQPVQIVAGDEAEIDVVNTLKPGRLQIRKEDESDNLLGGSCFLLDGAGGADYEVCDNEAGDQNPQSGVIRIVNVPVADYILVETVPPAGYLAADDQPITVQPNQTLFLTVINEEEPPPAQFGDLVIEKVDQDGDSLAGACFVLKQGAVTTVPQVCDNSGGSPNDGTITFDDVGVGEYQVVETKKPSNDYQTVAPVTVTIEANDTTTIEIENQLKPGRVLVIKRNQQGQPLQNACFDLAPDGESPRCSNASGQIIFDSLDPSVVYRLRETQAPPGYEQAPNRENIVVQPGLTTTIIVVDKKAPPPPDTGSVRVIKFYCSAGTGEERTEIFDSSDAGAGKLTKTAGCERDNARFTLDPQQGGNTIEFTTGVDGEYQATLSQGIYLLTETDPVLAGGDRTENIRIFTNQQTTVVVINYLKPPAPAPATIDVVKYTCDPGFEGVYYADFIANCGDQSSLTNNVTFRISGATAGKHVTGDTGQKGRTRFTQLIAGTYTLKEEPPSNAVTTYLFCGFDVNDPTLKAVGATITFGLQAGQTITCTAFNVPDDVSDTTGAIVVYKYVCDANSYPSNFQWYEECSLETDGTKFTLSRWTGEQYTPHSTGVTDANGLLRFSQLRPGTYQLKEIGADWCHAESDSVDKKGDVIVRAGFRATVWIFNCVDTKEPPNTGAGTTAGLNAPAAAMLSPEEASANSTLLLGLAWPVLGLAAYGWRRRRAT